MSGDGQAPLAGVCLGRTVPVEHVRALVLAGVLPEPEGPDELVARDVLAPLDPDPVPDLPAGEWRAHAEREVARFRDGRERLLDAARPERGRRREQQLMRIGSAAWGAALAYLMEHENEAARVWLDRAAVFYRRSLADAEPGSWGRSIGSLKARLLAADAAGARREAAWTLDLGAAGAASTTARYAACLAFLVLGRDAEAGSAAEVVAADESFPAATAQALIALASGAVTAYETAVATVLETFETRDRFLEDVPVADTVLTLQSLAPERGLDVPLGSSRLPGDG